MVYAIAKKLLWGGKAGHEAHYLAPTNATSYGSATTWGQRAKPFESEVPVPKTEGIAETNLDQKPALIDEQRHP